MVKVLIIDDDLSMVEDVERSPSQETQVNFYKFNQKLRNADVLNCNINISKTNWLLPSMVLNEMFILEIFFRNFALTQWQLNQLTSHDDILESPMCNQ